MKNQAYRMALLYDFYGDMLTYRQKEYNGLSEKEHITMDQ